MTRRMTIKGTKRMEFRFFSIIGRCMRKITEGDDEKETKKALLRIQNSTEIFLKQNLYLSRNCFYWNGFWIFVLMMMMMTETPGGRFSTKFQPKNCKKNLFVYGHWPAALPRNRMKKMTKLFITIFTKYLVVYISLSIISMPLCCPTNRGIN